MSNDLNFLPNSFMRFFCEGDRNLELLTTIKRGRGNQDAENPF